MHRLLPLLAVAGLFAATAAEARDERAKDKKDDGEWEDVEDEPTGPAKVKVPKSLQGRGYSLRLDGDTVALDKDEVTLARGDRRERVELVDAGGRILRSDRAYVDENVLDHVSEPRQFHLGLYFGGASMNGRGHRNLLQNGHLQEFSLDFVWQPSPLGLMVTLASQRNDADHDFGVRSTYTSDQTRIAATYEIAPFRSGDASRVHFLTFLGILAGHHKIKLDDDEVELEDEDDTTGGIVGVDTMYPFEDFWLSMRVYLSYQKVEFEDFAYESQSVQRGLLFGGYYAF